MDFSQIIKKPIVTEKSSKGSQLNKHTFVVHPKATKIDIKRAFKKLYGVDVLKVNSLKIRPKTKWGRGRREVEKRHQAKKIVITLKQGQKFEFGKLKTVK